MLRIDALWLCAQPVDMRAGAERLLAAVVTTLGEARAHHGYLFANARANQTTFSIPTIDCGDRVPVAPAARKEGSALPTGGPQGSASRPCRGRGRLVQGTAGVDVRCRSL
jgi:hypothetical protein